jgi:hypothetical protein
MTVNVKNYGKALYFEEYSDDPSSPAHFCYKADALPAETADGSKVRVHYDRDENLIAVATC